MTIEQLFGTLQQAIVGSWRKHLRTAKYGKHEALDEFYKEMPEKVDALIEAWMGANGRKIGNFENLLSSANYNTLSYLNELKKVCKQGYGLLGENDELKSLLDDIVNLINSTLYKVKELSESKGIKNLTDFINESLNGEINEAKDPGQAIKDMYDEDGDLVSVASCWHWLDDLDWALMSDSEYISAINDINDDLSKGLIRQRYLKALKAMQKMSREKAYIYIKDMVDDESELEDYDICESDVNQRANINESIKIGDLKKWEAFAKKNCPGDVMSTFNANLFDLFNDKEEWEEMAEEGQLEDFLCEDAWDNWFEDEDFDLDEIDAAKEFWDANYSKFFKF